MEGKIMSCVHTSLEVFLGLLSLRLAVGNVFKARLQKAQPQGVFAMEEPKRIEYPPHLKWMLKRALDDPEGFWGEVAQELHWFKPWNKVFEWNYPFFNGSKAV